MCIGAPYLSKEGQIGKLKLTTDITENMIFNGFNTARHIRPNVKITETNKTENTPELKDTNGHVREILE